MNPLPSFVTRRRSVDDALITLETRASSVVAHRAHRLVALTGRRSKNISRAPQQRRPAGGDRAGTGGAARRREVGQGRGPAPTDTLARDHRSWGRAAADACKSTSYQGTRSPLGHRVPSRSGMSSPSARRLRAGHGTAWSIRRLVRCRRSSRRARRAPRRVAGSAVRETVGSTDLLQARPRSRQCDNGGLRARWDGDPP